MAIYVCFYLNTVQTNFNLVCFQLCHSVRYPPKSAERPLFALEASGVPQEIQFGLIEAADKFHHV